MYNVRRGIAQSAERLTSDRRVRSSTQLVLVPEIQNKGVSADANWLCAGPRIHDCDGCHKKKKKTNCRIMNNDVRLHSGSVLQQSINTLYC